MPFPLCVSSAAGRMRDPGSGGVAVGDPGKLCHPIIIPSLPVSSQPAHRGGDHHHGDWLSGLRGSCQREPSSAAHGKLFVRMADDTLVNFKPTAVSTWPSSQLVVTGLTDGIRSRWQHISQGNKLWHSHTIFMQSQIDKTHWWFNLHPFHEKLLCLGLKIAAICQGEPLTFVCDKCTSPNNHCVALWTKETKSPMDTKSKVETAWVITVRWLDLDTVFCVNIQLKRWHSDGVYNWLKAASDRWCIKTHVASIPPT